MPLTSSMEDYLEAVLIVAKKGSLSNQKALKSLHFPTKCAIITARESCEKPGKGVQFWRM